MGPPGQRRRIALMSASADPHEWLDPKPAEPLSGKEGLGDSGLSVSDFWRWAFSDLRENILRGVLAEFLVAKAVDDPSPLRHAWDNYDVTVARRNANRGQIIRLLAELAAEDPFADHLCGIDGPRLVLRDQ